MIRLYTFLIFVAISTIILYAVFVMPKADFVGKTTVLVLAENTASATNMENTVNDMIFISQNAADNNADVIQYNAEVEIERLENKNMMRMAVYAHSKNDVDFLETSVLTSSVRDIKKYYSLEKDYNIQIVQGSVVEKTSSAMYAPYILMIVLAVGLVAGVLALFAIFEGLRDNEELDEKNIDGEKIFAQYNTTKQMTEEIEFEDNDIEENLQIVEEAENLPEDFEIVEEEIEEKEIKEEIEEEAEIEEEQVEIKKDTPFQNSTVPEGLPTTPGNLPVVDISDFGGAANDIKNTISVQEDKEAGKTEPTEEELKARLNELLNGKL